MTPRDPRTFWMILAALATAACSGDGPGRNASGPGAGPGGDASGGNAMGGSGGDASGGTGGTGASGGAGGNGGGMGSLCDSLPPSFDTMPVTTALAGELYHYPAHATDPDGDTVFYQVVSDTFLSVDAVTGVLKWIPTAGDIGNHTVDLIATDSTGCATTQSFTIAIADENQAPQIVSSAPFLATANQAYGYNVDVEDPDGDTVTVAVTSGPAGMSASGTSVSWTPSSGQVGVHHVVLTATDSHGASDTQSYTLAVGTGVASGPPSVFISAPAAYADIQGFANVNGSVSDSDLLVYFIDVCDENGQGCVETYEGTGVVSNGLIGKADTGVRDNGFATLRVRAYDQALNQASATRKVKITGGLKVGHVEIRVVDLDIAAPGLPLQLIRSYSSLDRGESHSFGYGWKLEIADGYQLEEVRNEAEGWDIQPGGIFNPPTVDEVGDPHIYIFHTPDREPFGFFFYPDAQLGGTGFSTVTPVWYDGLNKGATMTPQGGTPNDLIFVNGSSEITDYNFTPYTEKAFTITTAEGLTYDIHEDFGLESVSDTNGNALSVSNNSISHSNGRTIQLMRDGNGRITRATDPVGNQTNYFYDSKGNLERVEKPEGITESYRYAHGHLLRDVIGVGGALLSRKEYDERGRLVKETNGEGHVRSYSYDDVTGAQTIDDGSGLVYEIEYDNAGNVTAMTKPGGATITMQYDADNNMTQRVEPGVGTSTYQYNSKGQVTQSTRPHAQGDPPSWYTITNQYNAAGKLTQATIPGGGQLRMQYDGAGNVIAIRDQNDNLLSATARGPKGVVTSDLGITGADNFTHNAAGDITSSVDPYNRTFTATRNAAGDITSMTYPWGETGTFAIDGVGRITSEDYGNGKTVNYAYLGSDWTEMQSSNGATVRRQIGVNGQVKRYENAAGDTTQYLFDDVGRTVGTIDPLGRVTQHSYSSAGYVDQIVYPDGSVVSHGYDIAGRLTSVTNEESETITQTFAVDGRIASLTDPLNRTTSWEYTPTTTTSIDPLDRETVTTFSPHGLIMQVDYPDGTSRSFSYLGTSRFQSAEDFPTSVTDEGNHTRSYGYDSKANMTSSTDLSGQVYTLSYAGNALSSFVAPEGETISYDYDEYARVSALHHADGETTTFQYDAYEAPTLITLPSGATISNTFGIEGDLAATTTSDGESLSYSYDAAGRRTGYSDATGNTQFAYDLRDRLTLVQPGVGGEVRYEYDRAGRVTAVEVVPSASAAVERTEYSYDAAGQLVSVIDPLGGTTTFDYDAAGRLVERTLPNGIVTSYGYDLRDRLVSVVHEHNGSLVRSVSYTRGPNGEPLSASYDDGASSFSYDGALRLTGENHTGSGAANIGYSYDDSGKRTQKSFNSSTTDYNYGAGYRLVSTSGAEAASYSYDQDGNVTQLSRGGDTIALAYSALGRVTSETVNGNTVSYEHDADGHRVRATDGAGERNRLIAPASGSGLAFPHAVADAMGNVVSSWVYAGNHPLMRIDENGDPVYYLEDAQGSVIALADGAGNEIGRLRYDGFGNVLAASGATDAPAAVGGDFRFHGHWLTATTGLYHMRARDYDPLTGRFLSRDPVGADGMTPETHHRYAYALSNPLLYSDPSGMFSLISVNISMNFNAMMQNIKNAAIQSAKEYIKDKITEFFMQALLSQIGVPFGVAPGGPAAAALDALSSAADGAGGEEFENFVRKSVCSMFGDTLDWVHWAVFLRGGKNKSRWHEVAFNGFTCGTYSDDNRKHVRDEYTDPGTGLTIGKLPEADFVLSPYLPSAGGAWLIGDFKYKASTIKLNKDQSKAMAAYARKKAMHIMGWVVWTKKGHGPVWYEVTLRAWALAHGVQASVLSIKD